MTRSIFKEDSFGSFLDLIFEADGSEKKKKKKEKEGEKKKKKELGDVGAPLEFPDDPLVAVDPPFNAIRFTKGKGKKKMDLTAQGFGQPYYTPKTPAKPELNPADILRKLKQDVAAGVIEPAEFERLRDKVISTTSTNIKRKGTAAEPGSSAIGTPKVPVSKRKQRLQNTEPRDFDDYDIEPYRGADEFIGNKKDIGKKDDEDEEDKGNDKSEEGNYYRKIAQGLSANKVKVGDRSFKAAPAAPNKPPEDAPETVLNKYKKDLENFQKDSGEYEEWQPKENSGEWSEADLPVKSYTTALTSVQGVRKEEASAKEKEMLASRVPKLVLQGMEKAAKDYKELLRPRFEVLKAAAQEYVKDLIDTGTIDKEDAVQLQTNQGLAMIVGLRRRGAKDPSAGFMEFFEDWIGSSKPNQKKIGFGEKRDFIKTSWGPVPTSMTMKSALNIVARLGIIDLDDDSPATGNTAKMLELDTAYEPELSRVEQFLILRKRADRSDPQDSTKTIPGDKSVGDPGFRYFFGTKQAGDAGQRYYWDWIRQQARKLGEYPAGANWATKGKMF